MTIILLVRHAAHDNVGGFLAGRIAGVRLGEAGRQQALRLAQRLKREPIELILTSPRERALETARLIATSAALPAPEPVEDLDEIDFGSWSGRGFDDLNREPSFQRWNQVRGLARTPAGESMLDVQARIVRRIERVSGKMSSRMVALVSHADVIKAAVSYYLGLPLDAWSRFDIEPASITTIALSEWGAKVTGINELV